MEENKELLDEGKSVKEMNGGKINKVFIVLIILLLFGFAGVGFVLGSFNIFAFNKSASSDSVIETKTNSDSLKEIEVDSLIESLWNRVNFFGMLEINNYDELNYDGIKVSEMSDKMKGILAAKYFTKTLNELSNNRVYVNESDVQYGYDSIFGSGTYKSGQKIYSVCANYTYNSDDKRYESVRPACGGTSLVRLFESIINVEKNSSNLVITSVMGLYKYEDYKLFKNYDDAINDKNALEVSNTDNMSEFMKENKDSLAQYKYTFELDSNGFYKYLGYEKIN